MEITPEMLRLVVDYNPETGKIYWKKRDSSIESRPKFLKMFNSKLAGKEAFAVVDSRGYLYSNFRKKQFRAHQVAWAVFYGEFPDGHIDHINGNRQDNRIENLRCVSRTENNRNCKRPSTNSSGVVGVSYVKKDKRWHSYIYNMNKRINLGYFKNFDEAVELRKFAEEVLGYHPNHGRAA